MPAGPTYSFQLMELAVEVEKTEGNQIDLSISVPGSELESRKDTILADLRDRIELPGFRKGHVPKSILEKRFGSQATAEGLDGLLKEAVQEAFERQKLSPIDTPKISDIKMDDGRIRFRVTVEVKPEVKLTDEQILRIRLSKPEGMSVTDADVDAALENERRAQATFQPELEDRPARNGDFAVVDYEGFMKDTDKALEGGKGEGALMEMGSGRFLPGFDEHVVGMKAGDQKRIEIVFPKDFYDEDLRDRAAYFHVTLRSIKKRLMADLTDQFAKDAGYENLADMRAKIRADMERGAREVAEQELRQALFRALDEQITFDPPKSFVDRQAENLQKNLERQYRGGRQEMVDQLAKEGKTEADLDADLRARARRQVKNSLILDAVAKFKHIHVTDEDVETRIARIADQSQATPDAVRNALAKEDRLEDLRYSILDEKVVQFLLEHADIR